MKHEATAARGGWRRSPLAAAGVIVIVGSVVVSALNAPRQRPPSPTRDEKLPAFEVASIKPNRSGDDPFATRMLPGGGFSATNVSVRTLIRQAYGRFQEFQVSGGPSWLDTEHFDIVAKAEGPASPPEIFLMVRTLLADRFKLTTHQEMREAALYALVLARNDGRLGPQLRPTVTDCAALAAAARASPTPPAPGGQSPCGMRISLGAIVAGGSPMSRLATALSDWVSRIVVDRTGLAGDFDIELHWTPEGPRRGQPPPGAPPPPPIDPNGPSIFTALQEQLGLKLESTTGPVDVLVIDGAERPSSD